MTISAAAQKSDDPRPATYLVIGSGEESFLLPSNAAREVTRWLPPTPIPGAPPALIGIISHRGRVLPVLDLRIMTNQPATQPQRLTRYAIVAYNESEIALLVDQVYDLVELDTSALEAVPTSLEQPSSSFLSALTRLDQGLIGVIDIEALGRAVRQGNPADTGKPAT